MIKSISRVAVSLLLVFAFLSSALPCGPGYVTPVFEVTNAPEHPYSSFAGGQLGIIKPAFRRSLLYAAYRYINGGSFSPDEQKALVELWMSDIDRDYTRTDDISETVKAWVDKRKDVVGKEEKTPDIYVERAYGGYDFFPNCAKNAFETAMETLADRVSSHGPSDPNVMDWVRGQDEVFGNCSSGKQTPDDPPIGAPDWLQKDRAYQKAAAAFYSLDYNDAKRRFAEIAQDSDSPWSETADYLVARTLIRQASLSKSAQVAGPLYDEAERHLQRFISGSGKFAASAQRLAGLIQYRRHPKERVSELAKTLAFQSGDDNFKQDLIDYTWLLDKFENEILTAEAKRKAEDQARKEGATPSPSPTPVTTSVAEDDGDLKLNLYSDDFAQTWVIAVPPEATDDDAVAEAERVVGKPLSEEMKKRVRESRQTAYAQRFANSRQPEYEGGSYAEGDSMTPSMLPDFLQNDDLTSWLFIFQMKDADAYLYSAKKFRESGSDLWLMTAISKADKNSADLKRLLEAADRSNRTSPAYFTIAYHAARIYLDLGKNSEARRLIEPMMTAGDEVPISVRNQFVALKLRLAETFDDFLTNSLRRPFAFDFSGSVGSIDELIAREKTYYDPEYNKDGREAYDREVEERYKDERQWQDRLMLDSETINMMNQNFPQSMLLQVESSPALPDYLRSKFAIAIWTRAYLLDDYQTLLKITPEIVKYQPEFSDQLQKVADAKTPMARQNAGLFFILKNPLFSPYLEDGMGKSDNEFNQWDANDWWCSSYMNDSESEADTGQPPMAPPKFLKPAQKQAAASERKKIADLADAPQYLAKRVLAWAVRSPADRRVPEALYIVHQANGWTKYGCGNNEDLQKQIADFMNRHYPSSEWTRKLTEDQTDK